jgi:hypothetical protein
MGIGKIIGLYEYFYSKVYHFDFTYKNVNNSDVTLKKFLNKLDVSMDEDWLFYYLAFQFEYWDEKRKYMRFKISPSYIFGDKAFKRYEDKVSTYGNNWMYFTENFIRGYQLDNTEYYKKDLSQISIPEENDKLRFEGKERLANCIINTTLYNRKSKTCVTCNFMITCKRVQEIKYPGIFKLRKNETGIKKESRTQP